MDIEPLDPTNQVSPIVENQEGEEEMPSFIGETSNLLTHLHLLGALLQNIMLSFNYSALPLPPHTNQPRWSAKIFPHNKGLILQLEQLLSNLTLLIEGKGILLPPDEKTLQKKVTTPQKQTTQNRPEPSQRIQLLQQIKSAIDHISVMQKSISQSQQIFTELKGFLSEIKERIYTLSKEEKLSTSNKLQISHLLFEMEKETEQAETITNQNAFISKESEKNILTKLVKHLIQLKKELRTILPSEGKTFEKDGKQILEKHTISQKNIPSFSKSISELHQSKHFLTKLMEQDLASLDPSSKKAGSNQPLTTPQNSSKSINSYVIAPYTADKKIERRGKKKKKKSYNDSSHDPEEEQLKDLPYYDFE